MPTTLFDSIPHARNSWRSCDFETWDRSTLAQICLLRISTSFKIEKNTREYSFSLGRWSRGKQWILALSEVRNKVEFFVDEKSSSAIGENVFEYFVAKEFPFDSCFLIKKILFNETKNYWKFRSIDFFEQLPPSQLSYRGHRQLFFSPSFIIFLTSKIDITHKI